MSLSILFYLVATICFGIEAIRSKSLIAIGLTFFAAAFIIVGVLPIK